MKDPLCREESPYQVLGVPENAPKKVIDAAFKKLLVKGKRVNQLREAWNTLSKPVDRTFENIFLYSDHFAKVQPRKLLQQRQETAVAFAAIERKLFPHVPSIHSLAILWLQWAIHGEEGRLAGLTGAAFEPLAEFPGAPPLETRWTNAIVRWAYLFPASEFWESWLEFGRKTGLELSPEELEVLKQRLRGYFNSLLYGYQEKYRNLGRPEIAAEFQKHEALFLSEGKLGEQMARAQVTITIEGRPARISCGKGLLAQLGLFDPVQERLGAMARTDPGNPDVQALLMALSPFGGLQEMLDAKKFPGVLASIETMPEAQRKQPEILRMRATALLGLGREKFAADRIEEALELWQKGLGTGLLTAEFKEAVASSCRTRASAIQQHDLEAAFKLIERAMALVNAPELGEVLSSLLTTKGIRTIDDGYNKTKNAKGPKGDAQVREGRTLIERGIADLEKALKVNPGNERAREHLDGARNLLADLELFPVFDDLDAKRFSSAIPRLKAFLLKNPKHQKARELLQYAQQFQCWFCDSPDAAEDASHHVPMHLVEGREGNTIYIKTLKVPIPRCPNCRTAHWYMDAYSLLSFLGVVGLLILMISRGLEGGPLILTLIFSVVIWFALFMIGDSVINSKYGTRSESHGKEHPRCLALTSEGWAFGEKPPNTS